MIVGRPQVTGSASELVVAARIESERAGPPLPESLWFAFPRSCAEHLDAGDGAFAAALLPLAMHRGEPLCVEGPLSPRLAHGLREYQRVQSTWKPDLFRPVEVRCRNLRDGGRGRSAGAVGLAFSGGVDSFHALRSHLPENEPLPASRVTHCLMVNGFDEDAGLDGTGRFASVVQLYAPLMAKLGLELIVVRTNLLQVLGPHVRSQSFASFLTAPALLLGGLLSRFYIAAGCKLTTQGLYPDGSHLMLDHLLSTESMQTMTVEAHLSRVEKTVALASWPEVHDLLRVCSRPTGAQAGRAAIANCCACEKCLRTMMTLDAAGALDRFRCFPQPLLRERIRAIDYSWEPAVLFAREIVEFAARQGRRDIVRDIRWALFRNRWLRPPLRHAVRASWWLEGRSRVYRALVAQPKRLAKRLGWYTSYPY
jgi:hypothetical protein